MCELKTYSRKRLKHEKGYGLVPINGEIAKTFSLSYRAKEEYGNSFSEIELINCTIQKRWQDDNTIGLDVKGEYACRCFDDMLMYIMVYNEKNDLIAYNAEQCIDEHFTRSAFFETIICIPNIKKISKIEIRFGMSPVAVSRKGLY